MANIRPISAENCAGLYWKRPANYLFAGQDLICPITVNEAPKALVDMPIGLLKSDNQFKMVVLLGLHQSSNLYVHSTGRWLGRYIPTFLRSYPFYLLPREDDPELLMFCFNEDSGLLSENADDLPFFDKDRELDPMLKRILDLLQAAEQDLFHTANALNMLEKHNLLVPWEVEFEMDDKIGRLDGLYQVSEAILNEQEGPILEELRKSGALQLAYCQLISQQNIVLLRNLAKHNKKLTPVADEIDFDEHMDNGNIDFSNL